MADWEQILSQNDQYQKLSTPEWFHPLYGEAVLLVFKSCLFIPKVNEHDESHELAEHDLSTKETN